MKEYTHEQLQLLACEQAARVGIDMAVFCAQIEMESDWQIEVVSGAGAEGIAQIAPKWHPEMAGRTFDPEASLVYAADLMRSHIDHRGGDLVEALADYCAGRWSAGNSRKEGYSYAKRIIQNAARWRPIVAELRALQMTNIPSQASDAETLTRALDVLNRLAKTLERKDRHLTMVDRRLLRLAKTFLANPRAVGGAGS